MSPLIAWANFYVIIGSSAGALTGLTFVVITLIAQTQLQGEGGAVAAYTTPTIVHFGGVLFLSAVLSAPWPTLIPPALTLGLCGLAGALYTVISMQRQRRQDVYTPVLEDWLWFAACPFVAYLALAAAAALLPDSPELALFAIGGVMALLLFLGIHNAWDSITYIVMERVPQKHGRNERQD